MGNPSARWTGDIEELAQEWVGSAETISMWAPALQEFVARHNPEWVAAQLQNALQTGTGEGAFYDAHRAEKVLGLAVAVWNPQIARALEAFFRANVTRRYRDGTAPGPAGFGASPMALALDVMLASGVAEEDVAALAALPWEGEPIGRHTAQLEFTGGYARMLLRHGWHAAWIAWELDRQSLVARTSTGWVKTPPKYPDLSHVWNGLDRERTLEFLELYALLDEADSLSHTPGLRASGALARVLGFLRDREQLFVAAVPVIVSGFGTNDSLLVTLFTRIESGAVRAALTAVADHHTGGLGNLTESLLRILSGGVLEVPEQWTAWAGASASPPTRLGPGGRSRTWLRHVLPERVLLSAFEECEAAFLETMAEQYSANERMLTGMLLALLQQKTGAANRTVEAWARTQGRRATLNLTFSDHESGNVEGETGADIGLVLQVRDHGVLEMERACLVQAKKARVVRDAPQPSWDVARDQLERLVEFGDGGVYWFYGKDDGLSVVPARLVSAFLYDQHVDRPALHRDKFLTSAVSLSEFLLYGLIAGRVGECAGGALDRALAFGRPGTGPTFLVRIEIVFEGEQEIR